MKKINLTLLICLIIVIIITNLQNLNKSTDKKETSQNITASYGIKIENQENGFKYDGDYICTNIIYQNSNINCDVGILLFVNGIPQPYYTSDYNKQSYIHPYELLSNEEKKISIKFIPLIGKKGDNISILVGSMINPSTKLTKTTTTLGNNQKIFFLNPYIIRSQINSNNIILYSNDYSSNKLNSSTLEKYTYIKSDGSKINILDKDVVFELSDDDNNPLNKIESINNTLYCNIQLISGKEEEYTLTAYINHKPVPLFNNRYYASVKTKSGYKIKINVDFDLSKINISKYNSFYVIAIPKSNDSKAIQTSTAILYTK